MKIETVKAIPISGPPQRDVKGKFVKGTKAAGRPVGALTGTTKEVRQLITNVIQHGLLPTIFEDIAAMSPKDRVQATAMFAQIILPRMQAIAIANEGADGEVKKQVFLIGGKEFEF